MISAYINLINTSHPHIWKINGTPGENYLSICSPKITIALISQTPKHPCHIVAALHESVGRRGRVSPALPPRSCTRRWLPNTRPCSSPPRESPRHRRLDPACRRPPRASKRYLHSSLPADVARVPTAPPHRPSTSSVSTSQHTRPPREPSRLYVPQHADLIRDHGG